MWLSRITSYIRQSREPLLVENNLYGISEIANSLLTPGGHTYWIEFPEQGTDSLTAGHWGYSEEFRIESLTQAVKLQSELVHESLRPIVILTRIENALDEVCALLGDMSAMRQILLMSGTPTAVSELSKRHPHIRILKSEFLNVTESEAIDCLGRDSPLGSRLLLSGTTGVSYEAVREAAFARLGLGMPARPSPAQYSSVPACLSKNQQSVVQILTHNRQWKRALDVAIATMSSDLIDVVDFAGEDAIHRNELDSFRRKLEGLPDHLRNQDKVLYWLLVSEASLGIDTGLLSEITPQLFQRKLPRVQVLLRVLGQYGRPGQPDSVELEEDPAQAMYLAHLRSFNGSPTGAIRSLRRLLDRFELSGSSYRFIQTMLLLTNSLIMNGAYKDATYWGRIAIEKALESGSDELEIATATASLAYAQLLTGYPDDAAELLSRIPEAAGLVGLPYAEGIISTMADHFALSGHYATALSWYELSISKSTGPPADIVAADIALMLVRLGKSDEAEARCRMRMETLDADDDSLPWVQLAAALSLAQRDSNMAIDLLTTLTNKSEPKLSGPFLARASICLALLYYRKQRLSEAFLCLSNAQASVSELGESGWVLLSGNAPDVGALMGEWQASNSPISIRFLGDDFWEFQNFSSITVTSKRIRELVLILSCFPNGLSSEKLADLMGWGPETRKTVRSHIRNLREYVPITTAPYRLAATVKADYIDLDQAIITSDVKQALTVYCGPLLVQSDALFIREHRAELEARLRVLVVDQGSPEQIAELALKMRDDMELLELATAKLSPSSELRPQIEGHLNLLRRAWTTDE